MAKNELLANKTVSMTASEIDQICNQCIQTTNDLDASIESLEDLSFALEDLYNTADLYEDMSEYVKGQLRAVLRIL